MDGQGKVLDGKEGVKENSFSWVDFTLDVVDCSTRHANTYLLNKRSVTPKIILKRFL